MQVSTDELKKILLNSSFVKEEDFAKAAKAAGELGQNLSDVLIFQGFVSEESLGQLLAEYCKVPFISLKNKIIPLEVLSLVPEKAARTFRAIPFEIKDNVLSFAMEDPQDLEAQEFVKKRTGFVLKPYFILGSDLNRALGQYKKNLKLAFGKIIEENLERAEALGQEEASKAATDLPIIKILDTLFEYAVAENASDIHIEVLDKETVIRFRIDGVLEDVLFLPKIIHPAIVARIKILSQLKIDEHRVPQDGRFKFKIDEEEIALRVSVIPAFYGENVALRILLESARPLSLEELGLTGKNLDLLKENIKKTHGMILVTGPTGSGKTTTLYSLLNMVNTTMVKICTIEDPIEYGIKRVNQIQINPSAGLTFASGLRSLLRHDPNIIMVGEIRDKETAEMGIHSALTGHLVLSTLHTNDASGAIPRFLDMGAEGFLLASTINAVIAQRLVRKICSACIEKIKPHEEILKWLISQTGRKSVSDFYKGRGCRECRGSGYKGRIGIFEILEVNEMIRSLILKRVPAEEIKKEAVKNGMIPLFFDGLNKIGAGITTVEEVMRVIKE